MTRLRHLGTIEDVVKCKAAKDVNMPILQHPMAIFIQGEFVFARRTIATLGYEID